MNKQKIKIDIVSDINCPWCYIGEHRLKKAIAATGNAYEFELSFKPFELNPQAPQTGEAKETYFIRNYGKDALPRLKASSKHLEDMGKAEGLTYNFEKAKVVHNTFNGHRLIWLAREYGVQEQVTTALYSANFSEGKNVNDLQLLKQIGVENGIPAERLENFFESEEGKQEVRQLEGWAQQAGISGVPAFIFNDKYLVSGAQPAETFQQVFEQLAPALQKIDTGSDSTSADSCSIDGSNC
jgi:predicted DsbA family dithiol-disulfide isomerase